jgi:hypothetical protein
MRKNYDFETYKLTKPGICDGVPLLVTGSVLLESSQQQGDSFSFYIKISRKNVRFSN